MSSCNRERVLIDLIDTFPDAEKRTSMGSLEDGFSIQDVTIGGVRRRCIMALPTSRITWEVDVPRGSVLRAAVALRPDAWLAEGDGAVFDIAMDSGGTRERVFRRAVQPFALPRDRRWFQVDRYIGSLAGKRVRLVFTTEPGLTGNAVNDAALWCDVRIASAE